MAHPGKTSKQRPEKQKRDRDATRAALLVAGEALFAARSFEGATFDAIAKEAGVNKALIAYYFGSKEGLYDAVIANLVDAVLAAVRNQATVKCDATGNFRRYIRALTNAIWERPTFAAILMREYLTGTMQERKRPFSSVLQFYRMTEQLYSVGRKTGEFRRLDPHTLHLSIIGPIVHFTVTAGFRERAVKRLARDVGTLTVADFGKNLERIILDGVKRDV